MTRDSLLWAQAKARLNHDILKNQVLQALSYLIRVMEGRIDDDQYLSIFLEREPIRWAHLRSELSYLIGRFESEMSPARSFDFPPLNELLNTDRDWMAKAIHRFWWVSQGMGDRIDSCARLLTECDEKWTVLENELKALRRLTSRGVQNREARRNDDECATIHISIQALFESCRRLSEILSQLPSTLSVFQKSNPDSTKVVERDVQSN